MKIDKDELFMRVFWTIACIFFAALIIYGWRDYVIAGHEREPDQYTWVDELWGIEK